MKGNLRAKIGAMHDPLVLVGVPYVAGIFKGVPRVRRLKKNLKHLLPEVFSRGFVEGFNNKLKVMKRRCYGILNLKHLFQRLVLDTIGY